MEAEQIKETDKQLVKRVQKGDKRAFDLLVLKHQYKVQAIVSRYIKDFDEVNDVTQEAFIKAYRAIARFREIASSTLGSIVLRLILRKTIWCLEIAVRLQAMWMWLMLNIIQAVTTSRTLARRKS